MRPALIGDIGGTNARFALVRDDAIASVEILNVADFQSLGAAIEDYLGRLPKDAGPRPRRGALAVAGPVTGDFISLTNHPWSFSIKGLTAELGFERLQIVNDFVAQALAVPTFATDDCRQVGSGVRVSRTSIGVIGPGTGLGVSSLIPADPKGWIPVSGEGGHVTLSTATPREAAIIAWLRRNGEDHISAERLISGPGISTLYTGLAALDGRAVPDLPAAAITALAQRAEDAHAVEAIAMFCALLGTAAGNLALTIGARGGIYIAGGIVPRLGDAFDKSAFRERFVAKGRMRSYLEPIPTYVIIHENPAFAGLRALVASGLD